MKKIAFPIIFLLLAAFFITACSPTVPNNTTSAPETTAAPETTSPQDTTAAPETTSPQDTTAATEALPVSDAAHLSFGMPPAETDELLSFPGLTWGISLEEALDILALEESDYEIVDQITRQTVFLNNAKWFGVTSSRAKIAFDDDMLTTIYICYPDDADMQAAKENLEAIYGRPSDGYTYYRRRLPQEVGYQNDIVVPTEYESNEQRVFWVSDVHYDDYLGEEKTADWAYHMRAHNTSSTLEAFEKIAELNSFSSIMWSTNGAEDAPDLDSQNVVVLACNLLMLSAAD